MRVTFKNLAAMKIFVGMDDNLLILDTHVAKVLGMNKKERSKYTTQKGHYEDLLNFSERITNELRDKEFEGMIMANWSLSIWFNKARIRADALLWECERYA